MFYELRTYFDCAQHKLDWNLKPNNQFMHMTYLNKKNVGIVNLDKTKFSEKPGFEVDIILAKR